MSSSYKSLQDFLGFININIFKEDSIFLNISSQSRNNFLCKANRSFKNVAKDQKFNKTQDCCGGFARRNNFGFYMHRLFNFHS